MRHDSITGGSDQLIAAERTSPTVSGAVTSADAAGGLLFSELASRYLANRELVGLKRTTLMDYESYTRVHLVPAFGALELESITIELIEAFIAAKRQERERRSRASSTTWGCCTRSSPLRSGEAGAPAIRSP